MIIRLPTLRRWTVLAAVWGLMGLATTATRGQSSGHHVHPPMSDQPMFVHVRWGDPPNVMTKQHRLSVASVLAETQLDQTIDVPETPIQLLRYLPRAALQQTATPADSAATSEPSKATSLLEISVEGPTQSLRRWLVADDPQRNRLISFIATWRFMAVADDAVASELFKQFETEFTREPRLVVSRINGEELQQTPLDLGKRRPVKDSDCTIEVLRFVPDYAMDDKTNEVISRSTNRRNPAMLVEVTCGTYTEQRWIFAKFPAFDPHKSDPLPIRIRLDCPAEAMGESRDFALIAKPDRQLEVWARLSGKVSRSPLKLDEPVRISGTQYKFAATNVVPAGILTEQYKSSESADAAAALLLEVPGDSGTATRVWLALGETKTVASKRGPMTIGFAHQSATPPGGHP